MAPAWSHWPALGLLSETGIDLAEFRCALGTQRSQVGDEFVTAVQDLLQLSPQGGVFGQGSGLPKVAKKIRGYVARTAKILVLHLENKGGCLIPQTTHAKLPFKNLGSSFSESHALIKLPVLIGERGGSQQGSDQEQDQFATHSFASWIPQMPVDIRA
jgi:hypothetical protein